jgi:hypothetical protein
MLIDTVDIRFRAGVVGYQKNNVIDSWYFAFKYNDKLEVIYPTLDRVWFEQHTMEDLMSIDLDQIHLCITGGVDKVATVSEYRAGSIIEKLLNNKFVKERNPDYTYELYSSNTLDFNCDRITVDQWISEIKSR